MGTNVMSYVKLHGPSNVEVMRYQMLPAVLLAGQ